MSGALTHLTVNALEFLEGRYQVIGPNTPRCMEAACDGTYLPDDGNITSGDVARYEGRARVEKVPTCPQCAVLWDAAMEKR